MNTATHDGHVMPSSDYRFDHPRLADIVNDMYVRGDEAGPGDTVAPFQLETTDGQALSSADLSADGRPTLLVFGSRTCPVTESAADGLRQLHASHGQRVRFVLVQVREAHPGEQIPQPHTATQKKRRALELKRHHRIPFDVAADDIDGALHRALGARPSSAYLLDSSMRIVFRAQWANQTEAIDQALAAVVAGTPPPSPIITRTLRAMTRTIGYMSAPLRAAGRGAVLDTWKVAPPMALMMTLADLFPFLAPHRRGLPVMFLMGAAMTGAVLIILGVFD